SHLLRDEQEESAEETMKYFTPELLARYASDNDEEADQAAVEWEKRCEQYQLYLATVEEELPQGFKDLYARYYLHDARVLTMGRHDHTFVITLRLDPPPCQLVTLTYELSAEPHIVQDALPHELRSACDGVEWQYAEIERLPGDPPTWKHSILLSNGWE